MVSPTASKPTAHPERGAVGSAVVDQWFVEQVLPLEGALLRFLQRNGQASDDLSDLRQDIYVRLYESATRDGLPAQTQAYVFACARNLLIDRARREQVVSMETVADLEELLQPGHDFTPERIAGARGELRLLQAALDELPPRCREVVSLRKIEGLSQREVAAHMGIAQGTVEKQMTLGMCALAESLLAHGVELAKGWGRRVRGREYDA